MTEQPNRRSVIKTVGVMGVGGLVGCTGRDRKGSRSTISPSEPDHSATDTSVETTTHPEECDLDYERVNAYTDYTTLTEQLNGFILRRSKASVQRGETISFHLTNKSDEEKNTGNNSKYDIQHRTDDGWQSIFWKQPDNLVMHEDDAILHPPEEGFVWVFTVTRDALSREIEHGSGHLEVCAPLLSGSYRFVFHGETKHGENNQTTVLGTEFSIKN